MPHSSLHIAIICSRLDQPGGIERACVNTANLFAENGHKVSLLVADVTSQSFYPLHATVELVQAALLFGMNSKQDLFSRKLSFIKDIIRLRTLALGLYPDVLIATEYPFAVAMVLAGLKGKMRLLSWEHFHFYELKKSRFWHWLVRICYPRLQGVVVLNKDEQILFRRLNIHCTVIPNFIPPATTILPKAQRKRLLTIAHLSAYKKGFDLFPAVAGQVLLNNPDWEWKVIGKGDMEKPLLEFIDKENLQGRLLLQPPSSHDIESEYTAARVFVLTSRYECFPMTMLEAMRAGVPCIAFDCETGPRAIIQHGVNGLLVEKENIAALVSVLDSILKNETERENMGYAAAESVKAFSPDVVCKMWVNLFKTL